MIDDSELLAIESLAKAATGGKWWVDNSDSDVWGVGDSPSPLTGASYPIAQNIIDVETSEFIAHCGGDNGDVLRLVSEVRRLNANLFDAERKAAHLDEESERLKSELGGKYRDYNMKVLYVDGNGSTVTMYGTLLAELEKR